MREKEQYVLNRIWACTCQELVNDPDNIIERLMTALQQDRMD